MAKLRGLASTRNIVLILSLVAFVSLLTFYTSYINASPVIFTINVTDIVNGDPIASANVSLINCSNGALLAYAVTPSNGSVHFNLSESGIEPENISPMGFMVYINQTGSGDMQYYINGSDDNNSQCYYFTDERTIREELYPSGIGSFNVTVRDYYSGRPVPDAVVRIYADYSEEYEQYHREGDPTSLENYRCENGTCTTDENGQVLLFARAATSSSTVRYFFSVSHEYYTDRNTTMQPYSYITPAPIFREGMMLDEEIEVNGSRNVDGYVFDLYNGRPVAGAAVSLVSHPDYPEDVQIGYDGKYFYNVTTDSSGHYQIYIPADLIDCEKIQQEGRPKYDVKVTSSGYLNETERNCDIQSCNGFCGGQTISNIYLTGEVNVSGTVIDNVTKQPVTSASVFIYNDTINYTALTDSDGTFLVRMKNVSDYTVSVTAGGYNPTGTIGTYSGSDGHNNLGYINLTGLANITGRIIDVNPDDTSQPIPLIADVTFAYDGKTHTVQSGADGNFQVYMKSGVGYTVQVDRPGYHTHTLTFTAVNNRNDLGDLELTGLFVVNGTVTDDESCDLSTGCRYLNDQPNPLLSGVDVYVHDDSNGNVYKVTTDTNGFYSISIPSEDIGGSSVRFYTQYEKSGYTTAVLNNSNSYYITSAYQNFLTLDTYLSGGITAQGQVRDAYSPGSSYMFLPNVTLEFFDTNTNAKLYEIKTGPDGGFAINLGVNSNYYITVSKPGYESRQYGGSGGYPYNQNQVFDDNSNPYISLTGLARLHGIITDAFSGYPAGYSGSPVTVTLTGTNDDGRELNYINGSVVNGSYEFRFDSTILIHLPYHVTGQADGYPQTAFDINDSSADLEKNFNLTAYFQTILKDAENNWGIQNAYVQLYHYYNKTDYNAVTEPNISYINETTLNVSVSCEGNNTFDNINVTLVLDSCPAGSSQDLAGLCYRSQNTTGGYTLFDTVATGSYTVTVDGSQIGCSVHTDTLDMPTQSAGLQTDVSYSLDETELTVMVIDPIWIATGGLLGSLAGANVNITTPGIYTDTVPDNNGDGTYTFHFVRNVTNNITANDSYHYLNYSYYNATPGSQNDFTSSPIVLQPLPANMSIYVTNSSGEGVEDGSVNVSIANSTAFFVGSTFYTDICRVSFTVA